MNAKYVSYLSSQCKDTGPSMSSGSCVFYMTSYGTAQVSSCTPPDTFWALLDASTFLVWASPSPAATYHQASINYLASASDHFISFHYLLQVFHNNKVNTNYMPVSKLRLYSSNYFRLCLAPAEAS